LTTLSNCSEKEFSEFDVLRQAEMAIARSFLDYMLLSMLRKNGGLNGHEIIDLIRSKVDVSLNCGMAYSSLCLLELKGLINSEWVKGKKVYKLTNQGEQTLDIIIGAKEQLVNFAGSVLDAC
jgi:DNA-binding PadR family transcriptional regulator